MKHIWLNIMKKKQEDLINIQGKSKGGSHEILINQVGSYLKEKNLDARNFNIGILQLKKMRVSADYLNELVDCIKSQTSLSLSSETLKILNTCK